MFRLRRYRYFVFFAAVIVFLLYKISQNSDWDTSSASIPYTKTPSKSSKEHGQGVTNRPPPASDKGETSLVNEDDDLPQKPIQNPATEEPPIKIPDLKPAETAVDDDLAATLTVPPVLEETRVVVYDKDGAAKTIVAPLIDIPDKNIGQGAEGVNPPDQKKPEISTTTIHWKKVPEHFPVPTESIIPLPTGKPIEIRTIQHNFEKESAKDRKPRESRQEEVKQEMRRGWTGYMKYARGHDELSPITKKFRDPFCGWAATLVDSLDTLWIMGMKDEFEEALLDVEKIDFTTSLREQIPVFETTIRYLGGLVAAYDVSGGEAGGYDILLVKAVELAEILMGVFDTPNRMPILYYNWKPVFASQVKSAAASVSVAELGSLAMEFTRLAQITKEKKYYDAVARITDAFYEWQERGTSIPGIFPETIDAAGCNHTAQALAAAAADEAVLAELAEAEQESEPDVDTDTEVGIDSEGSDSGEFVALGRRADMVESPDLDSSSIPALVVKDQMKTDSLPNKAKEPAVPKCIPQGLDAAPWGQEQYGMGGSQDSTYEYFPKQWLLLGGLEPKYKTLHSKVSKAVKKWLLYRPMVPDNRDILFSAKVKTQGNPETDATSEYEVTHLTCFLGGMFGLAGKIFDVPADVEIGKKLADGCVWAYESTASGIMPEGARVVPCADVSDCKWNETLYHQWLDPLFETRDAQVAEYDRNKAELKRQKAQEEEDRKARKEAETKPDVAQAADQEESLASKTEKIRQPPQTDHNGVQKRAPPVRIGVPDEEKDSEPADAFDGRSTTQQVPLEGVAANGFPRIIDPDRPPSHEEYVKNKIETENLPPGFVEVMWKHYILRPEAIESVWYMYRITGDRSWQEKGWKMFKAIVSQTRTEAGNSAIDNVLKKNSGQNNEMESFWTAETLKYFYLLYSEPSLISLDEWVLNTEAHPFKRPI